MGCPDVFKHNGALKVHREAVTNTLGIDPVVHEHPGILEKLYFIQSLLLEKHEKVFK